MNHSLDWIDQWNQKKDEESARAADDAQQSLRESLSLSAQTRDVWQRYIEAFTEQTNAVGGLKGVTLSGSTTRLGQQGAETGCMVDVTRLGPPMPYFSRVIFYSNGFNGMRVVYPLSERPEDYWSFELGPDGKAGISYEGRVLSPEKLAQKIVRIMAESVTR